MDPQPKIQSRLVPPPLKEGASGWSDWVCADRCLGYARRRWRIPGLNDHWGDWHLDDIWGELIRIDPTSDGARIETQSQEWDFRWEPHAEDFPPKESHKRTWIIDEIGSRQQKAPSLVYSENDAQYHQDEPRLHVQEHQTTSDSPLSVTLEDNMKQKLHLNSQEQIEENKSDRMEEPRMHNQEIRTRHQSTVAADLGREDDKPWSGKCSKGLWRAFFDRKLSYLGEEGWGSQSTTWAWSTPPSPGLSASATVDQMHGARFPDAALKLDTHHPSTTATASSLATDSPLVRDESAMPPSARNLERPSNLLPRSFPSSKSAISVACEKIQLDTYRKSIIATGSSLPKDESGMPPWASDSHRPSQLLPRSFPSSKSAISAACERIVVANAGNDTAQTIAAFSFGSLTTAATVATAYASNRTASASERMAQSSHISSRAATRSAKAAEDAIALAQERRERLQDDESGRAERHGVLTAEQTTCDSSDSKGGSSYCLDPGDICLRSPQNWRDIIRQRREHVRSTRSWKEYMDQYGKENAYVFSYDNC